MKTLSFSLLGGFLLLFQTAVSQDLYDSFVDCSSWSAIGPNGTFYPVNNCIGSEIYLSPNNGSFIYAHSYNFKAGHTYIIKVKYRKAAGTYTGASLGLYNIDQRIVYYNPAFAAVSLPVGGVDSYVIFKYTAPTSGVYIGLNYSSNDQSVLYIDEFFINEDPSIGNNAVFSNPIVTCGYPKYPVTSPTSGLMYSFYARSPGGSWQQYGKNNYSTIYNGTSFGTVEHYVEVIDPNLNIQNSPVISVTTYDWPAPPTVTQDYQYCGSGPPVHLTASTPGATSYTWSDGQTSQSISTTSGTYTATAKNAGGCQSNPSQAWSVLGDPSFNSTPIIEGPIWACSWETVELNATNTIYNPSTGTTYQANIYGYQWNTGQTSPDITVGPGTYSVNVLIQMLHPASGQCWITGSKRVKLNTNISCSARERTYADPVSNITEFGIYPNPVSNELQIRFSKPLEFKNTIQIVDTHGRTVHKTVAEVGTKELLIGTTEFVNGLYSVVIKENLFTRSYHVVVIH
jgi:hypothetical protein